MENFDHVVQKLDSGTDDHARYIGKDWHLWKRRTLVKKTDTCEKDGHLCKRRALMEKTGIKHLKARFFTHTGHNQYYTYNTSYKRSLGIFRTHRKSNY